MVQTTGSPQQSTDPLTLERVEVVPLVAPLAREFKGSHYRMTHRATVIVRLHTVEGIVGEAYAGDEVDTVHQITRVVRDEIAPRLVGSNLMATASNWERAYSVTYDILRDRRIGLVALAAFDAAGWDAVGKRLDVPLYTLWGGAQESVPMIAIGGYYGEPLGSIEKEIGTYRELGFSGIKFKVGEPIRLSMLIASAEPETPLVTISSLRSTRIRATQCPLLWNSAGEPMTSRFVGSRSRLDGQMIVGTSQRFAVRVASPSPLARASSHRLAAVS